MDLFLGMPANLLPYEGESIYFGPVMSGVEADTRFSRLLETVAWQHDAIVIFGRRITTKREVAWYGDSEYAYTYSNTTKVARLWTPELLELKALAEQYCGQAFNSCLLNLYHNGDEGMAWHADDEKELGKNTTIASLSLGAPRRFLFKHRASGEKREVVLEHGSLLVMKGTTQSHWLHSLPKSAKVKTPRINLTFRTIIKE